MFIRSPPLEGQGSRITPTTYQASVTAGSDGELAFEVERRSTKPVGIVTEKAHGRVAPTAAEAANDRGVVAVLNIEDFSVLAADEAPPTLLGVHGEVATDIEVVRPELARERRTGDTPHGARATVCLDRTIAPVALTGHGSDRPFAPTPRASVVKITQAERDSASVAVIDRTHHWVASLVRFRVLIRGSSTTESHVVNLAETSAPTRSDVPGASINRAGTRHGVEYTQLSVTK